MRSGIAPPLGSRVEAGSRTHCFSLLPDPTSQEIARLLESRGAELLGSGGTDTLVRLANELPPDLRVSEIEQLLGEALVMHRDMNGAIEAFERAAVTSGGVDAGLAWRLGMAHHFNGSLPLALESYSRAGSERGDTPDDALLLAWSASTHGIHYRISEARTLADAALDLARRCGDDRALAAAHIAASLVAGREGKAADGDAHNAAGLAAAERCGDLLLLSRVRTNIAAGLTERGAYQEALVVLEETMRLSDIPGFVVGNRTFTNRARTHLHLGLLDEAAADFGVLVEDARRTGDREGAWGIAGLGDVHRERGNHSLARAAYEEAIPLLQQIGGDGLALCLSGMARVLVDDDGSAALHYAEWALREPAPSPAPSLNALGWVALALGQRERAVEAAAEAGRRARALGDRYALAEALELEVFASEEPARGGGRLEDALAIWRGLESRVRIAECELAIAALSTGAEAHAARERAERKLRALGVRVSPSAPAGLLRTVASAKPVPVSVQILGGFSLLRDGMPVPQSAWQTRKPRELLKILICRRGRATPRELVMESLWPGEDPAKLGNRLSVALSTLRSVLDPEKRFAPEHFVRADRESISVNLDAVLVDVEVFLHEAENGLALRASGQADEATEWLAQAEGLYAGDVLDGDPYGDWAVSIREEAQSDVHLHRACAGGRCLGRRTRGARASLSPAGSRPRSLRRARPPRARRLLRAHRAARRGTPRVPRLCRPHGGARSGPGCLSARHLREAEARARDWSGGNVHRPDLDAVARAHRRNLERRFSRQRGARRIERQRPVSNRRRSRPGAQDRDRPRPRHAP